MDDRVLGRALERRIRNVAADGSGAVGKYACHEGNVGLEFTLSAARP